MRSILLPLLLLAPLLAPAADPASAEVKLRENLRSVMLQLRQIQGERDTLAAEKTQLEQQKTTLIQQNAALTKQAASDQEESARTIADLQAKNATLSGQLAETQKSLEEWKVGFKKAADLAQNKEAARAVLAQEKLELQRKVADQQTRNLAMHRLGLEILTRYENFGLGTAIAAREPFTSNMRVKLENLVQDYSDKLAEQRIAPDPAPSSTEKAKTRRR